MCMQHHVQMCTFVVSCRDMAPEQICLGHACQLAHGFGSAAPMPRLRLLRGLFVPHQYPGAQQQNLVLC